MPEVTQRLFDIFFARNSYFAVAANYDGTVSYSPREGQPTPEQMEAHFKGETCLGGYTLAPDSTVTWLCWDVDSTDTSKARNIAADLSNKLGDVPHGIEVSGGKGYHIWVFFDQPVPAERAKNVGLAIREMTGAPASGNPHVEVYPKQAALTASTPRGNLVKMPLGLHPRTHNPSFFVDKENGWENGSPLDALQILRNTVSIETLEKLKEDVDPSKRIVMLMKPYWNDGQRHELGLNLAGYLATLGWSKLDVDAIIASLVEEAGGDLENLRECVDTTFSRLSEGKPIQGFSGLSEKLPVNVMRGISDLASQNIADPVLQIIDRIRLAKGTAQLLKARSVEQTVLANLRDTGRFILANETLYWLDYTSHKLLSCDNTPWYSMFHRRFGLNNKEAFGAQILNGVYLHSFDKADKTKVHKRFYWDGRELCLNFGGAEVYKLNGERGGRSVSYNGENGLFFATENELDEELGTVNLLEADTLDPWRYLTNDLNFSVTDNNAATNEQQQQMLRAWILQMFFGEILPTRPIALFLGPRGSGKTTSARRILRFFEGFHQDVLGITDDKQDSLRASIEQHLVLVLDNLEKTKAKWMDNYLNRLATGAQIELRRLHQTNARYIIKPDCFVILTGIEVPSNEEALFSRLLPFEMSPLSYPKPEYYMQSMLKDNLVGAWAGMLNLLDRVIVGLRENPAVEAPTNNRLADFQVFCRKIQKSGALNGELLMEGLGKLTDTQHKVMSHSSPVIPALEIWLEENAKKRLVSDNDTSHPSQWHSASALFTILSEIARKQKIDGFRWSNAAGFSRHFIFLVNELRANYSMEVRRVRDSNKGVDRDEYKFEKHLVH